MLVLVLLGASLDAAAGRVLRTSGDWAYASGDGICGTWALRLSGGSTSANSAGGGEDLDGAGAASGDDTGLGVTLNGGLGLWLALTFVFLGSAAELVGSRFDAVFLFWENHQSWRFCVGNQICLVQLTAHLGTSSATDLQAA